MHVRALFLASRLRPRHLDAERGRPETTPYALDGGGSALTFRFGVVVFVDASPEASAAFLDGLRPHLIDPFADPESEDAEIVVGAEKDGVGGDGIRLRAADAERLQVVAQALARSVVLAHYEKRVEPVFDRLEALAGMLRAGRLRSRGKALLREIGDVITILCQTVGRVGVVEKPALTWDDPDLDRLYERLAVEYELNDRDVALTRKLDLISSSAETYLDLLYHRRSLFVEWAIVALIVGEILLFGYQMFWQH